MKVHLTGWNGFLARKLREHAAIDWVEDGKDTDILFLMGSPTFTNIELSQHDAQVVHQYVRDTIKIIDRYPNHIIFASTSGVDDVRMDHKGSSCYNLGKLYLENYIINNCESYCILRIGTIISSKASDISMMRPDRIQQRIARKDFTNIPIFDQYLDIDVFVESTIKVINTKRNGIYEYPLKQQTLPELIRLGKQND